MYAIFVSHFGWNKVKKRETFKPPVVARPFLVFSTKTEAIAYVSAKNKRRTSEFSPKYSYRKITPKKASKNLKKSRRRK